METSEGVVAAVSSSEEMLLLNTFRYHFGLEICSSDTISPSILNQLLLKSSHRSTSEKNSRRETVGSKKALRMIPASCYMPYKKNGNPLGDDAHFVCKHEQVVGVADGVGGWSKYGVDAGAYARELMAHAENAVRMAKDGVEPNEVLKIAYIRTRAKGSSTACIVALKDHCIHSVNIGDSSFVVIRDGEVIYHSPVQRYSFNHTLQLGKSFGSERPNSAEVSMIRVEPGDVIVVATDGLFDNMFDHELAAIVDTGCRHGLKPEVLVSTITTLAYEMSLCSIHETPFSVASRDAKKPYKGGKRDDITVVMMCIVESDK